MFPVIEKILVGPQWESVDKRERVIETRYNNFKKAALSSYFRPLS